MLKFVAALAVVIVLFPTYAHAYLDPGSVTIMFQAIIGGILAASMTFKLWWYRLKDIVDALLGKSKEADTAESKSETEES